MRLFSYLVIAALIMLGSAEVATSQSALPATCGELRGEGGSASYSVGQLVFLYKGGTTGSASDGVQQPYEIYIVTGAEEHSGITIECSVFPNPSKDVLTLSIKENQLQSKVSYSLYDLHSAIMLEKSGIGTEEKIDVNELVSGVYFIKVIADGKDLKLFKIIKL